MELAGATSVVFSDASLPFLHRGYHRRGGCIWWSISYLHHEFAALGLTQQVHKFVKASLYG